MLPLPGGVGLNAMSQCVRMRAPGGKGGNALPTLLCTTHAHNYHAEDGDGRTLRCYCHVVPCRVMSCHAEASRPSRHCRSGRVCFEWGGGISRDAASLSGRQGHPLAGWPTGSHWQPPMPSIEVRPCLGSCSALGAHVRVRPVHGCGWSCGSWLLPQPPQCSVCVVSGPGASDAGSSMSSLRPLHGLISFPRTLCCCHRVRLLHSLLHLRCCTIGAASG